MKAVFTTNFVPDDAGLVEVIVPLNASVLTVARDEAGPGILISFEVDDAQPDNESKHLICARDPVPSMTQANAMLDLHGDDAVYLGFARGFHIYIANLA